jgi:hypothetical protein
MMLLCEAKACRYPCEQERNHDLWVIERLCLEPKGSRKNNLYLSVIVNKYENRPQIH